MHHCRNSQTTGLPTSGVRAAGLLLACRYRINADGLSLPSFMTGINTANEGSLHHSVEQIDAQLEDQSDDQTLL